MPLELFDAIESHDLHLISKVLSGAADPNLGSAEHASWTPMKAAIDEIANGGSVDALVLLIRAGANIESASAQDATPLLVAVASRQVEAVRVLLAAGANPNVRDDEGDSPLRRSVENGDLAIVSLLLLCGATKSINESGGLGGMNALGRAASQLNAPMIRLLLDAGADPEFLDADNRPSFKRLPPRETADPQVWDSVMAMLHR
jgi:uncharacterized protein